MSTGEKVIEARISTLAEAGELQNISRVCKIAGISRTHFYDIHALPRHQGKPSNATAGARRASSVASDTDDSAARAGRGRFVAMTGDSDLQLREYHSAPE